jgi:tol-pal system protein YbgF
MIRSAVKMWIRGAAPLIAALSLSACATDYGPPINGQRALSPEEQRLQAVENKTVDLSRRLGALEATQNGSQADDLRNMRGQLEQLQHDLGILQQAQQQQNSDFDNRLKRLEGGAQPPANPDPNAAPGTVPPPGAAAAAPPPVAAAPAAAPAAPVQTQAPANSSASADEEAIYLKSFDQLRAGKYDAAISGFRSMLGKYPQGNYADNAWYWMGQSYRAKQDDANALKSYQSLLQQFPASPKVPDSLLQTGVIYQAQQKTAQARDAYQKVLKQYPSSSAAGQAKTRLAQLK